MNATDISLFHDLANQDNIGLVLRGHLHVEHQLIKFIAIQLPNPENIDWGQINFSGKSEFALSCGLPVDFRPALKHIDTLRNVFANSLDAQIESQWVMQAYNGLPAQIKQDVETAYIALGKGAKRKNTLLDTRDLLVLIFLCVANAVRHKVDLLTRKTRLTAKSKHKKSK